MPTTNKRVNLTLTDDIYEKLQDFKKKNGIINDATACLQLVTMQLKAQENTELLMQALKGMTLDQIQEVSKDGLSYLKTEIDKK